MTVQDIAALRVIVGDDYPVVTCQVAVERDIVMIDLDDDIIRLPKMCNIRIGEHSIPS